MSFPERFVNSNQGHPGAYVDEEFSENIGPYLSYSYYDQEGNLIFFEDFGRDASPEYISEVLVTQADDILHYPPDNMSIEDVLEIVDELRKQAKHVPGLESK